MWYNTSRVNDCIRHRDRDLSGRTRTYSPKDRLGVRFTVFISFVSFVSFTISRTGSAIISCWDRPSKPASQPTVPTVEASVGNSPAKMRSFCTSESKKMKAHEGVKSDWVSG